MASILLVDDEADGSEVLVHYLGKLGHRARCVPNGREALAALTSSSPDMVVLDLNMPEMDGVTFLEVIRCYLKWADLPVVVLTALPPDNPSVMRAEQLGVKKIFHKADFRLMDFGACVTQQTEPDGGRVNGAD